MLADGTISSDAQVWTEGMESWQPINIIHSGITSKEPPAMPREHVYFDRGSVRVTNSRFLPGDQTFALSAINSVKLLKIPADLKPFVIVVSAAVIRIFVAIAN
jgi:hypothetical protein